MGTVFASDIDILLSLTNDIHYWILMTSFGYIFLSFSFFPIKVNVPIIGPVALLRGILMITQTMDGCLGISGLLNSISVISGQCESDNKKTLCTGTPFIVEKLSSTSGNQTQACYLSRPRLKPLKKELLCAVELHLQLKSF